MTESTGRPPDDTNSTQLFQPHAGCAESVGDAIGPYKLISKLGEGGFGIVYLAERREPHVQRVALKVIKPGMDSAAVIARFEQERQALAVMDHPNIARVYDAGTTDQGRPYFVMEHVQGEPITHYCDRHNLTVRQRLELFARVCDAVQHAHMKGIIHRDIKPSNVIVSVKDEQPIAKVIDFGVAKAISHTLTDKTIFTEHGQIIGTPEYMSPEQAEMGAVDIDTRTDVYSLGVMLYELLTGALPFDPEALRSKGYNEIQRIIREVDPPKPSTRFSSLGDSTVEIARHRRAKRDELTKELSRELDWIPLKAMRKDRTERYATAKDVADDIERYLHGQPLEARPESVIYRMRKFLVRNKKRVAVAASFAMVIILSFILIADAIRWAIEMEDERDLYAAINKDRDSVQRHLIHRAIASFEEDDEVAVHELLALANENVSAAAEIFSASRVLHASGQYESALRLSHIVLEAQRKHLDFWPTGMVIYKLPHARLLIDLNRFQEARAVLERSLQLVEDVPVEIAHIQSNAYKRTGVVRTFVDLYDAWHAEEPDAGHDEEAKEWRARLATLEQEFGTAPVW